MSASALFEGIIGYQQVNEMFLIDSVQRFPLGAVVAGADPYWGGGEYMYVNFTGTVRMLGVVTLTPTFNSTTGRWEINAAEAPNTANLGKPVAVSMAAAVSGNFGWVQISGVTPVNCQASVAADTAWGIAAAGQGGANSAGKQILNSRIVAAGATTVAKANSQALSGSNQLFVTNADGWFIGAFLSGTGIAAATTVASIDPSGRTVTLSANTTAAVAGTVTATYNNATIFYNVAMLQRSFLQGAIT